MLYRHHLWIRPGKPALAESSRLVDRSPREAEALLAAAGFRVAERVHLKLHYPREFWMARRVE